MKENKENHIIWLDLLRIVSVFCMMILHVCASQFDLLKVSSYEWQVLNVYDSLVRCCVPVFVMISGVFFLDPRRSYPLQKLLKNNILRIVTAYLFWAFCYGVVVSFADCRSLGREFWVSLIRETVTGRYHLWFLNMIVGIYLVVPFLRKITGDKKLTEYYILLAFFGCYGGKLLTALPVVGEFASVVLEKSSLYLVAGYTGYFVAGYYFYTYELSGKMRRLLYGLGAAAVLITMCGTSFLSLQAGHAVRTLYDYLFPTTCLSAWAVFLLFRERVSRRQWSGKGGSRITGLAGLCFGMYLVHDFVNIVLKLVGITPVSFLPALGRLAVPLAVPVLAAVVFAVSFCVAWVMSRIPFVKKYLM